MAVEIKKGAAEAAQESSASRGTRFPGFDLRTCVEVPRVLHMKGGGQATPDQMAAHLGYKGTNNGAYLTKMGATALFGLVSKNGPVFTVTPLAHRIISPMYPHDQKAALVEAFMNVPLFKAIYEEFKGKELPQGLGMKNALRLRFGVTPTRVDDAYRSLMESADTAGFFETKNGARTHLIMPLIQPVPGAATPPAGEGATPEFGGGDGGGGGDGDGKGNGTGQRNNGGANVALADVKAKYLSTLITLFEKKAEQGEMDEKLMERIERLIGATPAGA